MNVDGPATSLSDGGDENKNNEPVDAQSEDVETVLWNFRETWQRELQHSPVKNVNKIDSKKFYGNSDNEAESDINKARKLFLKGVEYEKAGKVYEALQFYRKAVQIVPDIEFQIDSLPKPNSNISEQTQAYEDGGPNEEEYFSNDSEDSDNSIIEEGELLAHIQRKVGNTQRLCVPKISHRGLHISALPIELILYILRWLVSSDLDLRSLETCSQVSRGFYLCARDSEIWRLACIRVWGSNCGNLSTYSSWRQMFIERPRLLFNGCYISKITYIRHGENNFQDQFYRPWHIVAYYRCFRFFPDGTVLMVMSPDEPAQSVSLLKYKSARYPVMTGFYRLKGDRVTIVFQSKEPKSTQGFKKNKMKEKLYDYEKSFHMELKIKDHKMRRHVQLGWIHYSIFSRNRKGDESTCNFELGSNHFPPLWFSRVKSYTAESESLLQ